MFQTKSFIPRRGLLLMSATLKEFVQSKSKSALLYTDLRVPETESVNYLSTPLT